jgi:hypothetical protein
LAQNPLYQRYRLYLSSGALLLAHAYARSEDYTAAVPLIERAIAIRENILTQDPQNTQAKERLADAYRELCRRKPARARRSRSIPNSRPKEISFPCFFPATPIRYSPWPSQPKLWDNLPGRQTGARNVNRVSQVPLRPHRESVDETIRTARAQSALAAEPLRQSEPLKCTLNYVGKLPMQWKRFAT